MFKFGLGELTVNGTRTSLPADKGCVRVQDQEQWALVWLAFSFRCLKH